MVLQTLKVQQKKITQISILMFEISLICHIKNMSNLPLIYCPRMGR